MLRTAALVVAAVLTAALATAQSVAPPTASPADTSKAGATSPADAGEPLPSFGSIFRDLGRDFRQVPTWQTATILGLGGAVALAVRADDAKVTRRASRAPAIDAVFDAGSVLGDGGVHFGTGFALFALGRAKQNARVARLGADLVRGQIVNTALTQGLKVAVRRDRPDGGRNSFPSGHSSAAFTTATVLQRHLGWKVGVPAIGVAMYVAGSRLRDNQHYMSDVIFGAAVGVAAGRSVTVGRGRGRFAVEPVAAPGVAGIGFTLVGHDSR
jgi:membrane-associated phospholipid phosphatase